MKQLLAGDIARILSVLRKCAAPDSSEAPWHHKGVRIFLNAREIQFTAVKAGQAITLKMHTPDFPGFGHFLLSHDDIADLMRGFQHSADQVVTINRSMQPLTRKPTVLFKVGDWFEGYVGTHYSSSFPSRSLVGRDRRATLEEVAGLTETLAPLYKESGIKVRAMSDKETTVTVARPITPVTSVICVLH